MDGFADLDTVFWWGYLHQEPTLPYTPPKLYRRALHFDGGAEVVNLKFLLVLLGELCGNSFWFNR